MYSVSPIDVEADVEGPESELGELATEGLENEFAAGAWGDSELAFATPLAESDAPALGAASESIELVFVDPDVDGLAELLEEIEQSGRPLKFVLLDSDGNGVEQVTDTLRAHDHVGAVHFITHGADGRVQLGNQVLSQHSLDVHAEQLAQWSELLAEDADLMFYGCELAETDVGVRFVESLRFLTGADVAASDDLTGAESRDGDWTLEYHAGEIQTAALEAPGWDGILPPPYAISGSVMEDVLGDADLTGDQGFGGASLSIWLDDGDLQLSAGDLLVASTTTDILGDYSASVFASGTYWVTVDSGSLLRNQGHSGSVVFDQTYGAAGSVSFDGSVHSFSASAGAHYGGLTAGVDDNQGGLATMQHAIRVDVGSADVAGVDFGFSASAITNTSDSASQGTLRTFIENAELINGVQTSQFALQTTDVNFGVASAGAWTIQLASDLLKPTRGVILDATTQAGYAGTPLVEIDGNNRSTIEFDNGTGSVVRGFAIYNARNEGVHIKANNTTVEDNYIGLRADGTVMTNTEEGVRVQSNNNTIVGNVIAGNLKDGIDLQGNNNQVISNRIGITPNDVAGGNDGHGIRVRGANNLIGSADPAEANIIAHNTSAGIAIDDGFQVGNLIRINEIFDNGELGIDQLNNGVVEDFLGSGRPVFLRAEKDESDLRVAGTVSGTGVVDFYVFDTADPTGYGEGGTYVGSVNVTAGGLGIGAFDVTFVNPAPSMNFVSAISTTDKSSEFSLATTLVYLPPVVDLDVDDSTAVGEDAAAVFTEDAGPIKIADIDASLTDNADEIAELRVTLTNVQDVGLEILDADVSGLSLTKSYDSATGELVISGNGTAAEYLSVLLSVGYEHTGDDVAGPDRIIQVVVADQDGNDSRTATSLVTMVEVNDAPVLTGPANATTLVGDPVDFSSAGSNAIVGADPDAGNSIVEASVSTASGTIDLGDISGVTFLAGDGTADPTVTFQGTLAAINAALDNLRFTPTTGFTGSTTVDITIDDLAPAGANLADSLSITVDVTPSFTVTDSTGGEDTAIPLSINPATGGITLNISGVPTGATLSHGTEVAAGQWQVDAADLATLTISPPANFHGTIILNVEESGLSEPLRVTVTPVNDVPTTSGIADQNALEDAPPLLIDLHTAFDDIETPDTALVYSVESTTNAGLASMSIDASNQLTITLNADAFGASDITVRATDAGGAFVDATFTLNVTSENDVPTTTGIVDQSVLEDAAPFSIDLHAAFDDVETSDADLVYTIASASNGGLATTTINGAGQLDIAVAANAFGSSDITVRAADAAGDFVETTFTLIVSSVNDTPTTAGIADQNVLENAAPIVVDLNAVFDDVETVDAALIYTVEAVTNSGLAAAALDGSGQLTVTLAANTSGSSDVTVRATDAGGAFVDTTFTLNVAEVNDVPTTTGIADQSVLEDAAPISIDLHSAFDDLETADADLIYTVQSATNGGLATTTIDASGQLTVSPSANAFGASDVTIRATDTGGEFVDATFTLTVASVNDVPTTIGIADQNVLEDAAPLVIDLNNIFDDVETADAALVYVVESTTNPGLATASVDGSGQLTVTLTANAFGSSDLTVRATDADGAFANATFTLNAASINDLPTGAIADVTVAEDAAPTFLSIGAAFDDVETLDGDLILRVVGNTDPSLVSASLDGVGNLVLSYTANQAGVSAITVEVEDADGGIHVDSFQVSVGQVPDAPVSNGIADRIVNEDSPTELIDLNAVFDDPDTLDSALVYSIVSNTSPTVVSASIDTAGALSLDFLPNQFGTGVLVVRAEDPEGNATDETFTVTVNSVNDLPTGSLSNVTVVTSAAPITIDLESSFADIETASPLLNFSVTGNTNAALVDATIDPTNVLVLQSGAAIGGTSDITITATDADSGVTAVTFQVEVVLGNTAPVGTDSTVVLDEDASPLAITLASLFADDDPLTSLAFSVQGNSNPGLVNAQLAGNSLTLFLEANAFGSSLITVEATDPAGAAATASVDLLVNPVNDLPVAVGEAFQVSESELRVSIADLLSNDSDEDDAALALSILAAPTDGIVAIVGSELVYTPNDGFVGTDSLMYVVSDGAGNSNPVSIEFAVAGVGAPPPEPAPELEIEPEQEDTAEDADSNNELLFFGAGNAMTDDAGESDTIFVAPVQRDEEAEVAAFVQDTREASSEFVGEHVTTLVGGFRAASSASFDSSRSRSSVPMTYGNTNPTAIYEVQAGIWNAMDEMGDEILSGYETEKVVFSVTAGAASLFSVGYVMWLAQGGYMLSTLMAQLPVWRFIDPLPVLDKVAHAVGDDHSLEELIDESNRVHREGLEDGQFLNS